MSSNQTINLNGKMFYNTEYLKHICPAFFHGCAKSHRLLISKKNISEDNYIYATYAPKSLKWKVSNSEVKSAKVLLSKDWVENNVPGFGNDIKLDLEIAPPLLNLKDDEKIKDDNGNVFEIETRGNKTIEGIYFYGKDIEKMLELECLRRTLNNEHGNYIEKTHYKKFIRPRENNDDDKDNESNNPERIYLTYFGLVKMLITRRHPIAEKFQRWAINILYTHQFGTKEEKQELSSKLLGCDVNSIKSFLNSSVQKYSELYLICLGKVKDIKEQIPELKGKNDEDYLFKYGYTSDLNQRLQSHKQLFNKIKNVNISLCLHCPIDENYLSEAEVELKQSFQIFEYFLEHPVYKELVVFNENKLEQFKKIFKNICDKYAGNCKQLQEQLEKQKLSHDHHIRELELKLKHEQELRLMEKNMKDELTKILLNLSRDK